MLKNVKKKIPLYKIVESNGLGISIITSYVEIRTCNGCVIIG